MPIQLVACNENPLCFGFSWTISDEDLLAELVARLLFGHYRHVQKILSGQSLVQTPTISQPMMDTIISRLTTTTPEPVRYQRDGWIFQMISWVAAKKSDPTSLSAIPHSQRAQKGFDNLIVKVSAAGRVESVVICEDKATGSPRDTIREKVWPEIETFESGSRDSELVNEVTAILERAEGIIDVDESMAAIFWDEARHYRVAITTNEIDNSANRRRLFAGYDTVVDGDPNRRRGDTFLVEQVRDWMDDFCDLIVQKMRIINV